MKVLTDQKICHFHRKDYWIYMYEMKFINIALKQNISVLTDF